MTPEQVAAEMDRILGRLEYANMQLGREAKFKREYNPEDARFLRGYNALSQGTEQLQELRVAVGRLTR